MAGLAFSLRPFAVSIGTLCAAISATGTHASSLPAYRPVSQMMSKSAAILGGQPSALEAVLSRQGAAYSFSPAPLPAFVTFRPTIASSAPPQSVEMPQFAASGRPDVLGTVALRLKGSRLDGKWRSVNHSPVHGRAFQFARNLRADTPLQRLEGVNRYVNRAVEFVSDSRQYGRTDVWATASETLRRGKGDCEDYAIAKLQMLRAAGFNDQDLYLVVARDLVRRDDHAVLVARANNSLYVLDDSTDRLLDGNRANDYRPIVTFASNGVWTHGYRVASRKPVAIAAADIQPDREMTLASDQRSRSASLLAFSTGFNK